MSAGYTLRRSVGPEYQEHKELHTADKIDETGYDGHRGCVMHPGICIQQCISEVTEWGSISLSIDDEFDVPSHAAR